MVLYLPLKLIFQDIKLLYLFYTYLMLVTLLFTKICLDGFPKYSRSSTLASVIKINLLYYKLSSVVQICRDALRWGFIFQWLSAFFPLLTDRSNNKGLFREFIITGTEQSHFKVKLEGKWNNLYFVRIQVLMATSTNMTLGHTVS